MRAFAKLYADLDDTTKTLEKTAALVEYFRIAPPADIAWAVYFLAGRKPRQLVPTKRLREWAAESAGVSDWLFEESYHAVGDLAETIALLIPGGEHPDPRPLADWVEQRLLPLRLMNDSQQHDALLAAWQALDRPQRFVFNKLLTGSFRVGVSANLVTRAFGEATGIPAATVAHRLMGDWDPTPTFAARLASPDDDAADLSRPYPFFLAHPLEGDPNQLGSIGDWQAEWKWDGIRSQLVRRGGQVFLWTRGEELVTDRYPELKALGRDLPDGTVIDGEILPWKDGQVMPFAQLQRRIGRKTVGKKLLADVPAVILAYDLLEWQGRDLREQPLTERRALLERLPFGSWTGPASLQLSPVVAAASWEELAALRAESRQRNVEGFMLKRRQSPYRVGRVRGDWWKWKIEPFTIDAVLVMAQRGSGKRASLFSDYTFSVWNEAGQLVPIAKAYSGLTDEEMQKVDAFVRRNTVDTFGPVRQVTPELVFELGFEGIQRSSRHKSGIAVRFPRMLRWRHDKKPADADTLGRIRALLPPET